MAGVPVELTATEYVALDEWAICASRMLTRGLLAPGCGEKVSPQAGARHLQPGEGN